MMKKELATFGLLILLFVLVILSAGGMCQTSGSLESGIYRIVAKHSGKCLDVSYGDITDGANVWQWSSNGSAPQLWKLKYNGSGYYSIIAKHSSKYLEVANGDTADKANVWQWSYKGTDNQLWQFVDRGEGYYSIIAKHSSKCLDVASGNTADGANVWQYTYNGTDAQLWHLEIVEIEQSQSGLKGDINDDGKIGLEEAIYALQIVSGIGKYTRKYYDVIPEIADNPAVQLFSNDINSNLNNWFLNAGEHWKNRQGTTWEDYINQLISTNPPLNPPNPPQSPAESPTQICEANSEGRCFYIDASKGNDTNPGTFEKPWKTYLNIVWSYANFEPENHINKKYGGLKPGDIIYFMSGEYSDTYVYGVESYAGFYLRDINGNENYPLIFKAYPGHHPVFSARRVLNPLTRSPEQREIDTIDGTIIIAVSIFNVKHLIIDGFEITNTYGSGLVIKDGTNIEVKNCWIHNIDGRTADNVAGLSVSCVDIKIHHNLLHDNYDHLFSNSGNNSNSGNIVLFGGGGHNHIYNNIIYFSEPYGCGLYYNSEYGCELYHDKGKGFGIKYKHSSGMEDAKFEVNHNVIWNCMYQAIGSGTLGSRIHHNLILESWEIGIKDFGGYTNNSDNIIEHNSIVSIEHVCDTELSYSPSDSYGHPIGLLTFRNNLVVDSNTYLPYHPEKGIFAIGTYRNDDIFNKVVTAGNLVFDNNVYFNQNVNLNTQKAWLLFNANNDPYNTSPQFGVKGDSYDFLQWQALGYDKNSLVFTKEIVRRILR